MGSESPSPEAMGSGSGTLASTSARRNLLPRLGRARARPWAASQASTVAVSTPCTRTRLRRLVRPVTTSTSAGRTPSSSAIRWHTAAFARLRSAGRRHPHLDHVAVTAGEPRGVGAGLDVHGQHQAAVGVGFVQGHGAGG